MRPGVAMAGKKPRTRVCTSAPPAAAAHENQVCNAHYMHVRICCVYDIMEFFCITSHSQELWSHTSDTACAAADYQLLAVAPGGGRHREGVVVELSLFSCRRACCPFERHHSLCKIHVAHSMIMLKVPKRSGMYCSVPMYDSQKSME